MNMHNATSSLNGKGDISSLVDKGDQLVKSGDFKQARKAYLKAAKFDPSFLVDERLNRANIVEAGQSFDKGNEKFEKGVFKDAMKLFLVALKKYPDPQILFRLYQIRDCLGARNIGLVKTLSKRINGTITKFFNWNVGYVDVELGLQHRYQVLVSVLNIVKKFGDLKYQEKIEKFLTRHHKKHQGGRQEKKIKLSDNDVRYPTNKIWTSLGSRVPANKTTQMVVEYNKWEKIS